MQNRTYIQSMRGAGVAYKRKRFITHTTLPFDLSALRTFSWSQRFFLVLFSLIIILGLFIAPLFTVQLLVGVISILYFIDTIFNLVLTIRSLNKSNEIYTSEKELQQLTDSELPMYTILCPLYKESHIIPQFIEAIAALDYPKNKLDVIILLEEDDHESINQVMKFHLPYYFRIIIVPDSLPKTKPKACNYGLSFARGEYLVIYDAEDIPDPLQLKKAYLGFKKVPKHVVCLQAKLNYYNARQNLLTRLFTAEYSLWFDITLTGLQSFNSTIPLGGTSNHFKTKILLDLEGWDPFNVTEDADLGIRLFKKGFKTAIIDSTTYEEATSNVKNWIRQRSRWIKGYMQTYLVHMRSRRVFAKEHGRFHNLIFQLTVGGKLLFLLLNPLLWVITIGYFAAYPFLGQMIETIYKPPVVYLAVFSWIFGNFLFLYYYMLGCAKRNQWDLLKYVYLVPVYWALMSHAAAVALYQLLVKPYYWEKTIHGFHLLQKVPRVPQVARVPRAAEGPKVQSVVWPVFSSFIKQFEIQNILNLKYLRFATMPDFGSKLSRVGLQIFSDRYSFADMLLLTYLLTFDFIVARLFLPANEVQIYFLLSLTAKIVVIIAQGMAYLTNTFLSSNKKVIQKFYDRIFVVFLSQWIVFIVLGFEGQFTVPSLFGDRYVSLIPYTGFYLFAAMCFAIGIVFSSYHAKRKRYIFTVVSLFTVSLTMPLVFFSQSGIREMVHLIAYLGTVNLMMLVLLHNNKDLRILLENNIQSFLILFEKSRFDIPRPDKRLRILIFNWRDTKHVFGGGAEVYIHELAKRWVQDGNLVTVFCGNDMRNTENGQVDGVEVVRRGGTYTVYLFAFFYYLLKFRGKYDIIIDCENGIPFFTPLFTRTPVILLIHHVHQEVFRNFLHIPWRQIAGFLEGKVMPYVYRNKSVVTVSESSKEEILKLGFTKEQLIDVVHNGVSRSFITATPKTPYPSFVYLGRLKEYKNIDIAITAFAEFIKEYKSAKLAIVGSGEDDKRLKQLTAKLHITKQVTFYGKVTEEKKAKLLSQSWAMLQPSQVEGWGITVIEANMAGTPVIASRVNGLKDSVIDGKTGILAGVKNTLEFTAAMKKIAYDTGYRNILSHNAYLWSKRFDWDKSASDFYAVIGKNLTIPVYQSISGNVSLALSEE